MRKIKGSCLCGAIQYQVFGDIKKIVNCHCGLCRKMNGSAFSTYAAVLATDFELLAGELKNHKISNNATKHFCGQCGTPVFNLNPKYAGLKILYFGALDVALDLVPDINIYSESKLEWVDNICEISSLQQGIA